MAFLGRSIHGKLQKKYKKANETRFDGKPHTNRVVSTTQAADEFIRDGFDVPGQAQLLMRERGMSVSAGAKADFGKMTPCPILKLEVGAQVGVEVLGKRTVLLMRGLDTDSNFGNVTDPVVVGCLDGWKKVLSGGVSVAVGVGFGVGTASAGVNSTDGTKSETKGPELTKSEEEDPAISSDVSAKVEFFAGGKAELNGAYEWYAATDDAPFLMGTTQTAVQSTIRETVEEVLREGTVKGMLKHAACNFINANSAKFGGTIKYETWGGLGHVSSKDIVARLDKGTKTMANASPEKARALSFMTQLGTWSGGPSPYKGLTYLRIAGPQGSTSASIGASLECSATTPVASATFAVNANLIATETKSKKLSLQYQGVAGNLSDGRPLVYFQDFVVKYQSASIKLGEIGIEAKFEHILGEYDLGEIVDDALESGPRPQAATPEDKEIKELAEALSEVWKFGEREGLKVTAAAISMNTMTYRGFCGFYQRPTKADTTNKQTVVVPMSEKTSGYVRGATFTAGNLEKCAKAIKFIYKSLKNPLTCLTLDGAPVFNDNLKGPALTKKREGITELVTAFREYMWECAGVLGVRSRYWVEFLKALSEDMFLIEALVDSLGEGAGLLVEAAYTYPTLDNALQLKVVPGKGDEMPGVIVTPDCIKSLIGAGETLAKRRRPPQVMRIRYRMESKDDASITLPLGANVVGVVEIDLKIKNVWNLEVEGIPVVWEYPFDSTLRGQAATIRNKTVVPPLLFRC